MRGLQHGLFGMALHALQIGMLGCLRDARIGHAPGLGRMAGLAIDVHRPIHCLGCHRILFLGRLVRRARLAFLRRASHNQPENNGQRQHHDRNGHCRERLVGGFRCCVRHCFPIMLEVRPI